VCVTVDAHAVCSAISAPKAVNGAQQYSGGHSCWTRAVYDAFETKPGRFQAEFLITHTITHITLLYAHALTHRQHLEAANCHKDVTRCSCGASLHGAPAHADAVILSTLE
jgi:hypothetical protein